VTLVSRERETNFTDFIARIKTREVSADGGTAQHPYRDGRLLILYSADRHSACHRTCDGRGHLVLSLNHKNIDDILDEVAGFFHLVQDIVIEMWACGMTTVNTSTSLVASYHVMVMCALCFLLGPI